MIWALRGKITTGGIPPYYVIKYLRHHALVPTEFVGVYTSKVNTTVVYTNTTPDGTEKVIDLGEFYKGHSYHLRTIYRLLLAWNKMDEC